MYYELCVIAAATALVLASAAFLAKFTAEKNKVQCESFFLRASALQHTNDHGLKKKKKTLVETK